MSPGGPALPDAEYVLPLRWADDRDLPDLVAYLGRLVAWLPVTVVDGSDADLFAAHDRAFPPAVRHVHPDPRPGRNGKVAGVVTGLRLARADRVVLADDDVRYDRPTLEAVLDRLADADVVRPQNVFDPLPWHARWDTARMLVNRTVGGDYPGTVALRRSALGPEGYDGDVLFENLELLRTARARGGVVRRADDLYVTRRPPTTRHFLDQRPRQAYDSLAQPGRYAAELAVLPAVVLAARRAPASCWCSPPPRACWPRPAVAAPAGPPGSPSPPTCSPPRGCSSAACARGSRSSCAPPAAPATAAPGSRAPRRRSGSCAPVSARTPPRASRTPPPPSTRLPAGPPPPPDTSWRPHDRRDRPGRPHPVPRRADPRARGRRDP